MLDALPTIDTSIITVTSSKRLVCFVESGGNGKHKPYAMDGKEDEKKGRGGNIFGRLEVKRCRKTNETVGSEDRVAIVVAIIRFSELICAFLLSCEILRLGERRREKENNNIRMKKKMFS